MSAFRLASARVVVLLMVGGCATWHSYDPAPTLRPGQSLPSRLRATRADSTRVGLNAAFIRSDSVYGRHHGDTIGIPLADITHLEQGRTSVWRTAAVIVGVPVVGFGLAYLIVCGNGDCEPDYLVQ